MLQQGNLPTDRFLGGGLPAVSFWQGSALSGLGSNIASNLASNMPSYRIADYFRAKPDIVNPDSDVVLATDPESGQTVALLAASRHFYAGDAYISLDTILVAERYQKTPLSARMLACLVRGVAPCSSDIPNFVLLTTGNPTSYCMMSSFTRLAGVRVYPAINKEEQQPEDANLAAALVKIHRPQFSFCKGTGVLAGGAGSVPPDFYPNTPLSRSWDVNAYFAKNLGPSDRLLCLMFLPDACAKAQLWNFLVGKGRIYT